MRIPTLRVLVAAASAASLPAALPAQARPSERGTVSQVVAGTTIALDYSRPVARGRTLFGDGGLVPWGRMWTPGANWATTIEADRDIRVNGHAGPRGRYSVWTIPGPNEWTVILSREARVFHTRPPADSTAQTRLAVRPERGPHMEALAWYFPVVSPGGTTLRLHWGTTVVPLEITVQPAAEPTAPERPAGTA